MPKSSPAPDHSLRNLMLLIGAGVGCAFILTAGLILAFGPSGQYPVKNALIAPDLVPSLAYDDTNRKTGGESRFVFENLLFTYPSPTNAQRLSKTISPEQYSQLYDLIARDVSLKEVPDEIPRLFNASTTALLAIQVRTESHAAWQDETKSFEEIKFAGDYYSIKLHEETATSGWIYFHHPGIYKQALQLLTP